VSPHSSSNAQTDRIGRYALLEKIGEGGMGVVHLARAPDGRKVALKVLRPHVVGDDEGRARLAREVSSLRRVRSRQVAEIYDADPWGERPYLVTRYVDGPSLHDWVREAGPVEGDALRAVAVGLAGALAAVHEAGVLHRDVKPSNVLIEGDHDPVLIDFGLAKVSEDSRLTATGWLMGTPGFLAPEVLYGEEATPAADVHAWAATVVFAATGESPFGRGPSMAVMDRARRGEYDLEGVPGSLQPLLRECLAPDPAHRPSLGQVRARLEGLSQQPPPDLTAAPATRPVTVAAPARQPPRERRPQQSPLPPQRRPGVAPAAGRSSSLLRVLLLAAILALFAAGVALAPYIAVLTAFPVAWLVRTASWTMDAMADRRALKGPRRSDGVVRTLMTPWYLVVSLPGTLVLLLAAVTGGALVATVLWALGLPDARALFAGGLLAGVTMWWGPGSRRLRRPTRRALHRVAGTDTAGVTAVGIVLGAVIVLLVVAASSGVQWWPDSGPPFDPTGLLPPGFQS
jgi:predicted Ser/Thr protein kinase